MDRCALSRAVHLFPQMLETDFRRDRRKSVSARWGRTPIPVNSPLRGLAARSFRTLLSRLRREKTEACAPWRVGAGKPRPSRKIKKPGLAHTTVSQSRQNHPRWSARCSCLRRSSIAACSFSFSRSTAATFCATRNSCICVRAFR